ncbi:MAG: cellulase family glycosylhydrolase [Lachnospiraceae bacterium]|nr:cellulase family glycosylhydrolase [Lachnospiraceae bacterium]
MKKIKYTACILILSLLVTACNKRSVMNDMWMPKEAVSQIEESGENKTQNKTESSGENKTENSGENKTEGSSENKTENSGENKTEDSSENKTENSGENKTEDSNENTSQEQTQPPVQTGIKPLKVTGTKITDYDGNVVQLRGVSTHGLSWFPGYVNKEAFTQFKNEWGCNVIRLAMYTAEYNGYCTGDENNKQNLKNLIDNGVNYATELGMYVIIDWHILNDCNPHTYKEESKRFFAEMSAKYKDHTNVIYEICNEPNGGTSWWDVKSYAEEVIPVIRANDPDAIIIVGTPTWSQDVDHVVNNRVNDPNVVYALHFYAATHTDWIRNKLQTALNNGIPVIVSEFSICDASGNGAINYNEASKWIDMIKQNDMGYIMWNLSNKGETSAFFNSWCQKTSGFTMEDLSETAKWFLTVR